MNDGVHWTVDHYEPKAGKSVGFWHAGGSSPSWQEMKNKWGFTWIVVTSGGYSAARNLGFHTMVTVGPTGYANVISSCPNAERFYSDEVNDNSEWQDLWMVPDPDIPIGLLPCEVFEEVYQIMSNIASLAHAKGAKYIISDYGQISPALRCEVDRVDGVMYSSYKYSPSFGLPKSDQRQGMERLQGRVSEQIRHRLDRRPARWYRRS